MNVVSSPWRFPALGLVALLSVASRAADYQPSYLDPDDPIHVDYDDSLDYPYARPGRLSLDGDIRGGYFNTDVDNRDGSNDGSDNYTLRLRFGGNYSFSDLWRVRARLAATCSDSECSPGFENSRTPSAGTNIEDGDVVVDEAYIGYEGERFSAAAGRLQTRSLARGGVFATAMTRLTSPNVGVNWTDGVLLRYRGESGWTSKLIAQYNDQDGSSTLARAPLDFDDDDSRLSWFYSLESLERRGPFTQLGLDVTWMPSALLADGSTSRDTDDYWSIVTRASGDRALTSLGGSLMWAVQLGYAPETQAEAVAGLGGGGDVDGWAWHTDVSWMNFLPGHSVGLSYGVADPGWLLSVSFRPNEEALTLRYHWRPAPGVQLEVQGRWREEQDQLLAAAQKRETWDYRIRLTWAFDRR